MYYSRRENKTKDNAESAVLITLGTIYEVKTKGKFYLYVCISMWIDIDLHNWIRFSNTAKNACAIHKYQ